MKTQMPGHCESATVRVTSLEWECTGTSLIATVKAQASNATFRSVFQFHVTPTPP